MLVAVHETDGYPVEGVADPVGWISGPGQLRAWVAELDGQIVGHVALNEPQAGDAAAAAWATTTGGDDDPIAVLGRLFVLSTARGHAIGRRLIEAASDYAASNQLRLVLDVMAKDAAAIALYERLGWTRIGTTEHDDGQGRLIEAGCFVSPE